MWCFLDDLRAFGINPDQLLLLLLFLTFSALVASPKMDDCSPGRGGMAQNGRLEAGGFMAKWIVAEKARAGLRHAVVCSNVTERTKERVAQSKRARTVRSP